MSFADLERTIESAWEARDDISPATKGPVREAVDAALDALDSGTVRVAEKMAGEWRVNEWCKKAVLLSFRLHDSAPMPGGGADPERGRAAWFDKVPLKTSGWGREDFLKAAFRYVPGAVVRRSAYIAPGAVIMPFTFSIAHGIAFGFITYAAAKILSGRFSEASPAVYILAVGFGLLYGFNLIG